MTISGAIVITLFGVVLFVAAALSRRDLLVRRDDREGMFDNLYVGWVLGSSFVLMGLSGFIGTENENEELAGNIFLLALVIGMYGVYAFVASPRWLWPRWRRELEEGQQREPKGNAERR